MLDDALTARIAATKRRLLEGGLLQEVEWGVQSGERDERGRVTITYTPLDALIEQRPRARPGNARHRPRRQYGTGHFRPAGNHRRTSFQVGRTASHLLGQSRRWDCGRTRRIGNVLITPPKSPLSARSQIPGGTSFDLGAIACSRNTLRCPLAGHLARAGTLQRRMSPSQIQPCVIDDQGVTPARPQDTHRPQAGLIRLVRRATRRRDSNRATDRRSACRFPDGREDPPTAGTTYHQRE